MLNRCLPSFLFEEFLFNRVRNGEIDLQNLVNQHLHYFIFVLFVVFLDL